MTEDTAPNTQPGHRGLTPRGHHAAKPEAAAAATDPASKVEKLERFKAYVHERLDKLGIPADPKPGDPCRIGARLDLLGLIIPRWQLEKVAQALHGWSPDEKRSWEHEEVREIYRRYAAQVIETMSAP